MSLASSRRNSSTWWSSGQVVAAFVSIMSHLPVLSQSVRLGFRCIQLSITERPGFFGWRLLGLYQNCVIEANVFFCQIPSIGRLPHPSEKRVWTVVDPQALMRNN